VISVGVFRLQLNKVTFKPVPPEMTAEQIKWVAEMGARGRE